MQIDPIKVTDYITTDKTDTLGQGQAVGSQKEEKEANKELKALSVDNTFYNKKGKSCDDEDLIKDVNQMSELGSACIDDVKNVERGWGEDATASAEEKGLDPMDMDAHVMVTVVDEIKLNLAKAGVDVEKMGGLDSDTIEAMTGSVAQAMELKNGLTDTLSDETISYLVKNELEPTVSNIYNATYSAPENTAKTMSDEQLIELLQNLSDKLDSLIEEAGLTENNIGETIDVKASQIDPKELCAKMLEQDIPVTKDNLQYMNELSNYTKPTDEEFLQAIDDIVAEGKEPEDAYLIKGYSLMDQAREAVDEVHSIDANALTDVTAKIQLTEVQLSMTVEATFTMMKNGIEVNTSDLVDLLDKLKAQEKNLLQVLMEEETGEKTSSNVQLYETTMSELADIEASPAAMLGRFTNIGSETLSSVYQVSVSVTAEFKQMEMTYEAVGTEVRADLGDSIKKAFANVDDILEDLGLESTESNEKAVRILAYNQMEITEESVLKMKASSELVNRTFKAMTPAVVTEMIKRGENPLDMTMAELKDTAEEIKSEIGSTSDSESFAKFLWKAEHTDAITEEERDAYVGVYRLLHQVEKTDGAAIGALMQEGQEVTLRNLMTAVRSSNHTGKEYEISDKYGALDDSVVVDLSITQQIEKAFMTNRCRDAKEAMTPAKMQAVADTYMDMDPDEFASAMEEISDEASEQAYIKNVTEQVQTAYNECQQALKIIEENNLPTSANMINAINTLLEDSNSVFKNLYNKAADQEEIDMEYLIQQAYERFAEACKTPEEMAEAEEALQVLAENVMKTMIETEDVETIDMDGIKLVIEQTKAMDKLATAAETYHIPIMIADEAGNLNLKIVRGTNEGGLIKMALHMQSTGVISSTFRYENGEVNGNIDCDTAQMRDSLAQEAPVIAQTMQEETGLPFSFSFGQDKGLSVNDIYNAENGIFEETADRDNEIQTEKLYSIARGFIKVIGEMFS